MNTYSFVAREDDIDFGRIIREAPEGTPFILVESRTRKNQTKESLLLVSEEVLEDERTQGFPLADVYFEDNTVEPRWGHPYNPNDPTNQKLVGYRYWAFQGRLPGRVRRQIDAIKNAINPKDTKVFVTLL